MMRRFKWGLLLVGVALESCLFADDSDFVRVSEGEYVRGFNREDDRDRAFHIAHLFSTEQEFNQEMPAHRVRISRPFDLGVTEVTVGQFRDFVEATGYVTDAERNGGAFGFFPEVKGYVDRFRKEVGVTWMNPGFEQTEKHPVVCVSFDDAEAYCAWLTMETGIVHRLPTEAEWEYACRAGSLDWYSWGRDPDLAYQHANVADGALESAHPQTTSFQRAVKLKANDGDGVIYTAEAGKYQPNDWGLHDMHGNVWEWCQDKFQGDHYARLLTGIPRAEQKEFLVTDPKGPETTDQHEYGDWRVLRGGSWFTAPMATRCSIRGYAEAGDAACYTGFRVLREVPSLE